MTGNLTLEDRVLIARHFGADEALDQTDSILVMLILEHIRRQPSVNRRTEITLTAIAALSEAGMAPLARSLMAELNQATFGS